MNNLPLKLSSKFNIHIICEGQEDYYYIKKLHKLNLFNSIYNITYENAIGNGNLVPVFINTYQSDKFDCILIYCDTDKPPREQFLSFKDKLALEFDIDDSLSLFVFVNPCTMQVMLLHFDSTVSLTKQSKKANSTLIESLTGISGYDAHLEQVKELCSLITPSNYQYLKRNLKSISTDIDDVPSTNFFRVLEQS